MSGSAKRTRLAELEALEALEALEDLVPRPLSRKMWRYVREGDFDGRYRGDRSRLAMAVAVACVQAGWARQTTLELFRDARYAVGDWLRTDYQDRSRKPRDAIRQFDRMWAKALVFVKQHPAYRDRAEIIQSVLVVLDRAEGDPRFRGVKGSTDLAVLKAHAYISMQTGKVVYGASVRQLAELAGVSAKTASKANKRLISSGWLLRAGDAQGAGSASWKLRAADVGVTLSTSTAGGNDCYPYDLADHDVWRWGALGKTSQRYYEAISEEPMTTNDLAERFSVNARTARGHMSRLQAHGLAEAVPDGWLRGHRSPTEVAEELGAHGRGEEQRRAHTSQREAFRAFQALRPPAAPMGTAEVLARVIEIESEYSHAR